SSTWMRSWRDWSWADGNFWDSGVQPQLGNALVTLLYLGAQGGHLVVVVSKCCYRPFEDGQHGVFLLEDARPRPGRLVYQMSPRIDSQESGWSGSTVSPSGVSHTLSNTIASSSAMLGTAYCCPFQVMVCCWFLIIGSAPVVTWAKCPASMQIIGQNVLLYNGF
ncbi:hypothetical protein, partial [Pseudomonas aeruginosa]|uniref:hypothetical protein n=1 Tax=Pseudomonas aeruginosa TaxID=287 RepID=UPI0039C14804